MRKIFLLLIFISFNIITFSQILFTYGNHSVSKEEFLKAYNKNQTTVADKETSLREYLGLYINFKLKVAAAKNAKIDTLPQQQYDVQAFKNQLQENYLTDEAEVSKLIDEAFERSQKDIHVQYFSIGPVDSSNTFFKATEQLYEVLQKGNTNYDQLVKEISDKYHYKIKTADLGYVTVFSLPYHFENIIYSLKPDQYNKPFLSKNILHIFKVVDERKAMGKYKIAQILLALPPGDKTGYTSTVKIKADSLYQLLKNGADFGMLAKQFSDDKLTYLNNGEMMEFGTGKYNPLFEKEVVSLKNNGDVSQPFLTEYGFHIIKRISQTMVPTNKNEDATYFYELKQKVLQDDRINTAKDKLLKNIITQIGFKRNISVKDAVLFASADSIFINKNIDKIKNSPINNATIFSFTKSSIKGNDWLNFINYYKNNSQLYKGESNAELLQKYINQTAIEYYKKHLADYNPQFAYQVKEFTEGNMLFEIMERNVWSKAANDSVELKKYYTANKQKYTWPESADVIIFNCKNLKVAQKIKGDLVKGTYWQKLVEENSINLQTDSARYELTQLPLGNVQVMDGLITDPVINIDSTASFIKIIKKYPANQQRSFEEAKGIVINDFQNKIEQDWITVLRKKYPVKINEAVFKTLLKE